MKKNIFSITGAVIAAAVLTGCAAIYEKIGKTTDEVHDLAVQKVSEYAETAVNKKIEKSEYLSEEGKAQLKADVAKLKEEILVRIAEIKAKTDAAKQAKADAKAAETTTAETAK